MSANPLLSIEGLTASVDEKTILHNVNLNVAAGETHVLMGPNGAGKSTLGHLVMGDPVYTVQDGRIVFDGQDITELTTDKRSRAGLFLSFQAPVEIPGVPLSSFLRASIAGRPGLEMKGKEFRRRVKELAAELNMDTAYLNRELGVGFSGGEKKKVEMLQLLLLQPKLAILDETDSGLDVDALSTVSHGMDAYRKSCDGSMLIITHNTRILEHLDVDRVHVMVKGDPVYTVNDGRIVFDGQDITELTTDKRSRAGLFLSFQAPVEIPGVPLSSFLRASIAGRPGLEMKGKEFRRRVKELAAELNMDTAYLNRELGVGFSGGEKKKVEMLQLLLLQPKLAILDETDSGLDVDALSTVSHGMDAYRKSCDGSMLIITHNTRILEHLDVDRVHVMVKGHIVREDDASLIPWIDKNGFETFEREAAEQRAKAEAAAAEQQA